MAIYGHDMDKSYSQEQAELIVKQLMLPETYIPILKIKLESIIKDVKIVMLLGAPIE